MYLNEFVTDLKRHQRATIIRGLSYCQQLMQQFRGAEGKNRVPALLSFLGKKEVRSPWHEFERKWWSGDWDHTERVWKKVLSDLDVSGSKATLEALSLHPQCVS